MEDSGDGRRNENITNIYEISVGSSTTNEKQNAFRCSVNHVYNMDLKFKVKNPPEGLPVVKNSGITLNWQ